MDRRQFLQSAGAAVVAGSLTAGATADDEVKPQPASTDLSAGPLLANITDRSVEVHVPVNALATGWIEYGPTESLGLRTDGIEGGLLPLSDRVLRFKLDSLKPGTTYHYRVHLGGVDYSNSYKANRGAVSALPAHTFTTLDPGADTATFTVWNDTHENGDTLAKLIASLHDRPTDFLMWNGDVTNNLRHEDTIRKQFFSPAGLAFAQRTPLMLGRGNHDVRGQYALDLPRQITGPAGEYHYGFRHGPLAAIVLDSGEDKPDDHPAYAGLNDFASYRTEQAKWLAEQVDRPWFQSAAFRVVFVHIPLFWDAEVPSNWPGVWGSGIKGWFCEDGRAKWHDHFVRGKVDVVISGHTHRHAYFPPNAEHPYGQLIGGGPKPEQATFITGRVDQKSMRLTVSDLQGKALIEQTWTSDT